MDDRSIAARVAQRYIAAATTVDDVTAAPKGKGKGPKVPKVLQVTPHVLEEGKKLHGMNSNSSYLYSPITAAEEAQSAVHKANFKFPYESEYQLPDGTTSKMWNYPAIYLDRYPASGHLTSDKESGEVMYNFHVNLRDARGKEVVVPIEGMHFFMAWLGNGGQGKGILITKRVDSHRPHLEGELEKLQKHFPGDAGPLFGGH